MDGCVKEGRLKAAWSMLDEMRQAGQKPDAVTFTVLIRACSLVYNTEQAPDSDSYPPQSSCSECLYVEN